MQTSIVSILFLSVFLGFIPVVFYSWFFFLRRKKKFQVGKQPTGLLVIMFFGGIGAVIFSFFAEKYLIAFLPSSFGLCVASSPLCQTDSPFTILVLAIATFLIVGPVEEVFKWLAVYLVSMRSTQFTRVIDGVKFGVAVGLGFAAAENALYLFSTLKTLDLNSFVSTFLLRFAISTLAHVLYTGISGYYIGKAQFQRYGRFKLYAIGLVIAIITHGLFDFVLFSKVGFYAIILLALMFGVVFNKLRSPENYAVRIPEFIRHKPAALQAAYTIPVQVGAVNAYTGYRNIYAQIPDSLRPLAPRQIKSEFIPKTVPSEFASVGKEQVVKEKLTVPQMTVPTRSLSDGDDAYKKNDSQALSKIAAVKIVDSTVASLKKKNILSNQ